LHPYPGPFGLVPQRPQQVGPVPLPQPQIVHPTRVVVGDALRVTDQQHPDPLADGERDHLPGGLMLGLMNAAAMAGLQPPVGTQAPTASTQPARVVTRVPSSCLEAARKGDLTIHLYTINVRDRRLVEALKAYTLASQACRREASP
jgi:hypothetical protein